MKFLSLLVAVLVFEPQTRVFVSGASPHASAVASATTRKAGPIPSFQNKHIPTNQEDNTSVAVRGGSTDGGLMDRLVIGFYFGLWYALNVYYNIINKKVLNILPAPMTIGSIQLGVGTLYVSTLWLLNLRARPTLTAQGRRATNSVGLWHAVGQLASMVSLGAGPVSFTHIVKALEPFFSAVVSGVLLGQWMQLPVYATLIPVVGGVGYACLKERSFSWLAFGMAMASNLAFALRAVLSKAAMSSANIGTNLTSANVFGLVTLASFVLSIPMALIGEGKVVRGIWESALANEENAKTAFEMIKAVLFSGFFHYINNEVMFLALGKVHPITLAVGNTMKRVFIMVASVLVFQNEITMQAGIGSAVGISGVLLYSLTKQHYENLAKAAENDKQSKRR